MLAETLLALVLLGRGAVGRWRRDTSASQGTHHQALEISLAAEIPRGEARARAGLAATALDAGEIETAVAQLSETVAIATSDRGSRPCRGCARAVQPGGSGRRR